MFWHIDTLYWRKWARQCVSALLVDITSEFGHGKNNMKNLTYNLWDGPQERPDVIIHWNIQSHVDQKNNIKSKLFSSPFLFCFENIFNFSTLSCDINVSTWNSKNFHDFKRIIFFRIYCFKIISLYLTPHRILFSLSFSSIPKFIWYQTKISQIFSKLISHIFISELKNSIETQVNELKTQIESKCVMQWYVNCCYFILKYF